MEPDGSGPAVELPPDWGVQTFLNDPESDELGWLKGTIQYEQWSKGKPLIKLAVGDCRHIIELEFSPNSLNARGDFTTEDVIAARVEKLDRLAEAINSFVTEAKIALYGWGDAQPLPSPAPQHGVAAANDRFVGIDGE